MQHNIWYHRTDPALRRLTSGLNPRSPNGLHHNAAWSADPRPSMALTRILWSRLRLRPAMLVGIVATRTHLLGNKNLVGCDHCRPHCVHNIQSTQCTQYSVYTVYTIFSVHSVDNLQCTSSLPASAVTIVPVFFVAPIKTPLLRWPYYCLSIVIPVLVINNYTILSLKYLMLYKCILKRATSRGYYIILFYRLIYLFW